MKDNPVSIEYEARWAPNPVWAFLRKKKFLSLSEIRNPELPARMMVSIRNTLSFPFHFCIEILKVKNSAHEVAKDLLMTMYSF